MSKTKQEFLVGMSLNITLAWPLLTFHSAQPALKFNEEINFSLQLLIIPCDLPKHSR